MNQEKDHADRGAPKDIRNEDARRRRKADLDAATRPQSGAAVTSAFAGAGLSAEDEDSESEAELKKAVKRDEAKG